jgi:hypothetical protein
MFRSLRSRIVCGETVISSEVSSLNQPHKMSTLNRVLIAVQPSSLALMLSKRREIWPSKSAFSAGSASRIHPPVFLITTAPDEVVYLCPLTHPWVQEQPNNLVSSLGSTSSPNTRSAATAFSNAGMFKNLHVRPGADFMTQSRLFMARKCPGSVLSLWRLGPQDSLRIETRPDCLAP